MSETSSVTKPIQDALKEAGYFVMRLNSGLVKMGGRRIRLCPEGTADLLLCPPHQPPIWIETKVEGNRTKPQRIAKQAEFAYSVETIGHLYVRATCLDDVLAVLRKESK